MPRIDVMYAYVTEDTGPDDEGVIAAQLGPSGWMPLVGADKERMEAMRHLAQRSADAQGKVVKLLEFSVRRQVEEIQPAIPDARDPDSSMLLTKFRPCQECGKNILVTIDADEGPKSCAEHN